MNNDENTLRGSLGEYSPVFTEPDVNNSFSVIFRGEYPELQNDGLKHKNKDAIARVHAPTQP